MRALMRAIKWAARAHYSLAGAFGCTPVENECTSRDCLSQSIAYRSDPGGRGRRNNSNTRRRV
jgi:hypothetical protein